MGLQAVDLGDGQVVYVVPQTMSIDPSQLPAETLAAMGLPAPDADMMAAVQGAWAGGDGACRGPRGRVGVGWGGGLRAGLGAVLPGRLLCSAPGGQPLRAECACLTRSVGVAGGDGTGVQHGGEAVGMAGDHAAAAAGAEQAADMAVDATSAAVPPAAEAGEAVAPAAEAAAEAAAAVVQAQAVQDGVAG